MDDDFTKTSVLSLYGASLFFLFRPPKKGQTVVGDI